MNLFDASVQARSFLDSGCISMKPINSRHALCAALLATLASSVGCDQKSNTPIQPAPPAQVAKPGPEESFELIVETFRRGVEDIPIGFVVRDRSGGHSMMTGRNEVTHELIPPANEGDPYKGVITVESESRYSLQRSTDAPEESANADQSSADQSAANLAPSGVDSGVEVLDPDLVTTPGAAPEERPSSSAKGEKNGVTVTRKADVHKRTYELVYRNGSWRLVTKLDPKTEKSIQYAFDRALESQS
jgi:hypothetical protein